MMGGHVFTKTGTEGRRWWCLMVFGLVSRKVHAEAKAIGLAPSTGQAKAKEIGLVSRKVRAKAKAIGLVSTKVQAKAMEIGLLSTKVQTGLEWDCAPRSPPRAAEGLATPELEFRGAAGQPGAGWRGRRHRKT